MQPLSSSPAELNIRPDLTRACQEALARISRPGTWLTGAQRLAIAEQSRRARNCSLCRERKQALSPYGDSGQHDIGQNNGENGASLPAAAIEATHRIATDPGRLKRDWVEDLVASDEEDPQHATESLSMEQYVELIGVVTQTISVDFVYLTLGLPLLELPAPRPGEPSRKRPAGAAMERAWVPMILPENLTNDEQDLYPRRTGNVIRALSLVPDEVRALKQLSAAMYLDGPQMMRFAEDFRSITRAQMELIAGRVSALNECFY